MRLTGKNLSNLDFSNYHIDPQSNFMESNLENADFSQAKFGFDFDHQVNFTGCFLLGAVFPKEGTANRASGKYIHIPCLVKSCPFLTFLY